MKSFLSSRTVLAAFAGLLFLGVVFVACDGGSSPTAPEAPTSSAAPPAKSLPSEGDASSGAELNLAVPEDEALLIDEKAKGPKVEICHRPPGNPDNFRILSVGASAVADHEAHGDNVVGDEVCDGLDNDCDGVVDNGGDALCEDGVGCTVDVCGGTEGCANTPTDSLCDDGAFCNGSETCDAELDCQAGTSPECDNGEFCDGAESCNEEIDQCVSSGDPCGDNGQFCDGTESCNETTDQCLSSGDPCAPGDLCSESSDTCGPPDSCAAGGSVFTYSATPNLFVPGTEPATPVMTTITVPDSGTICDINVVGVTFHTPEMGEGVFDLTDPSGTVTRRFKGTDGAVGDGFTNINFDDEAASSFPNFTVNGTCFTGNSYTSLETLSAFDGMAANGVWTLTVTDVNPASQDALDCDCDGFNLGPSCPRLLETWGLEITIGSP